MIDPGLRLGRAELALVQSMLEMGWLFTQVVRYIQDVESESMSPVSCHTSLSVWLIVFSSRGHKRSSFRSVLDQNVVFRGRLMFHTARRLVAAAAASVPTDSAIVHGAR